MPPYAHLSDDIRNSPVTTQKELAAGIEASIAKAVDRCQTREDLIELETELVHIVALTVARIVGERHGDQFCSFCLLARSYQFEQTIDEVAKAILLKAAGRIN